MPKKCPLIRNTVGQGEDEFNTEFGTCIQGECAAWDTNHGFPTCRMFDPKTYITHTRDWE